MMKPFIPALFTCFLMAIAQLGHTQSDNTPYDQLPGVYLSDKPSYNDDYPNWAKMLYSFPVNYGEVMEAYESDDDIPKKWRAVERYFKNWRRAVLPFARFDGFIELPDLERYHSKLRETQLQSKASDRASDQWTFLGPKETFWLNESGNAQAPASCPWQVNIYSFDVAKTDPNIIYCGTETGFMNKSIDHGLTWELLASNYYFGGGVTAVTIHPSNADIVYVAAGNQIHLTTDGGLTWIPLLNVENMFSANKLRINPINPAVIIAAANDGVYQSMNSGQTWSQTWNKKTYDVEIRPGSNQVYALSTVSGYFSLLLSPNGGLSFVEATNFPLDIVDESGGLLAVSPDEPTKLLAILLSENYTPLLYEGNIAAYNWNLIATGDTGAFPMDNGQGYYDLVLDISPTDADLVFVGTTTFFKSTDGGINFTAIGGYYGPFAIHPDAQDLKILPDGDMWIATDGGFSTSTDYFTSTDNYFSRNNGLVGSDMWGFDQGWNEDIIVGGRYHNGNTALADFYQPKALRMGGAESPTGWVIQGKSRHVAFNDLGNGWILPETAEGEPEGRFIFSKYPNMDEYGGRRGNLATHPNFYGRMFLGEGNGLWRSDDTGESWDLLHDFGHRVRYLQISYHNPEVMYADIEYNGLYRSADGGLSWELKPSLTDGGYGSSYWEGKTFFTISPYDENVVYACLQNGTWSADIGHIFRTADGGETWEDWTGGLSEYTKNLVIQPTSSGVDLVYLFSSASNGQPARVFMRSTDMTDWEPYDLDYPAGISVNAALPFFRDSKLRVGGNAGVWEADFSQAEYTPLANPWVEKPFYNCMMDTLHFDDHSMVNHNNCSWHWEITPAPLFMSNANVRNPKVVLGSPGSYTVDFTLTKDGIAYNKIIPNMVSATNCPSVQDCSNPAEIPKDAWDLIFVDSEEVNYPGLAVMAFDDNPETIWHTRWSTGSDAYPHDIRVDVGASYKMFEFTYLTRQDGQNGRINNYELYITSDSLNWGDPVAVGQFENTSAPQTIELDNAPIGRYFRLLALSEVNGNAWSSAAEFSIVGCDATNDVRAIEVSNDLSAFPIPTSGRVQISMPDGQHFKYTLYTSSGVLVEQGQITSKGTYQEFDLSPYSSGMYILKMKNKRDGVFRVKLMKE